MRVLVVTLAVLALGCGSRTGLFAPAPDAGLDPPSPPMRPRAPEGCVPVDDGCTGTERCNDGSDGDCDGRVDEGCSCNPGAAQFCFLGPPGRRGIGACTDGEQTCTSEGEWGECRGGIGPAGDLCTGRDDFCDGCGPEPDCTLSCPVEGDPRLPEGRPFEPYPLHGRDFYDGPVAEWLWRVEAGPCDSVSPRLEALVLHDRRAEETSFIPLLSGEYRVTLRVTTPEGVAHECSWVVHIAGRGLRVELCYPESETEDLDLYLHAPDDDRAWNTSRDIYEQPEYLCGWSNCKPAPHYLNSLGPVDWGYAPSPLSECENGLLGDGWRDLGFCRNPRIDIDNNTEEASGVPENINLDNPRDGETFRVMVNDFSGGLTHPLVNIYCGGRRAATYGGSEDPVPMFAGDRAGDRSLGAMWRVADITVHVGDDGETIGCSVRQIHPPGRDRGFDVTYEDARF